MLSSDDDDVIKIASANGGGGGGHDGTIRGVPGQDDSLPPRACTEHLQLADWTGRITASAPLLPSDVVVCLGTCRHGGYQTTTTTTTTGTVVPPPSYDESVCRCAQHHPAPLSSTVARLSLRHHHPESSGANDLLNCSHAAARLNYYTNRS